MKADKQDHGKNCKCLLGERAVIWLWVGWVGQISGPAPLRNAERREEEDSLLCKWPGCSRRCKSKDELAIHVRRMHDQEKAKIEFSCDLYWVIFKRKRTPWIITASRVDDCLRRTPIWEDLRGVVERCPRLT